MAGKSNFFIYTPLMVLLITFNQLAQVIGRLYPKSAADSIYGPVINSAAVNTSDLQMMTLKTQTYIMFSLVNGSLIISDNKRNSLFPSSFAIPGNQVFSVFSVSIVQELMTKGGSSATMIEHRQNVLTLTNGDFTLEMGQLCPPFCF